MKAERKTDSMMLFLDGATGSDIFRLESEFICSDGNIVTIESVKNNIKHQEE